MCSRRSRHTRSALVAVVQTGAVPIFLRPRRSGPESRASVAVEGHATAALARPRQQGKEPLTALGVENPKGDGRRVNKVEAGEAVGQRLGAFAAQQLAG